MRRVLLLLISFVAGCGTTIRSFDVDPQAPEGSYAIIKNTIYGTSTLPTLPTKVSHTGLWCIDSTALERGAWDKYQHGYKIRPGEHVAIAKAYLEYAYGSGASDFLEVPFTAIAGHTYSLRADHKGRAPEKTRLWVEDNETGQRFYAVPGGLSKPDGGPPECTIRDDSSEQRNDSE